MWAGSEGSVSLGGNVWLQSSSTCPPTCLSVSRRSSVDSLFGRCKLVAYRDERFPEGDQSIGPVYRRGGMAKLPAPVSPAPSTASAGRPRRGGPGGALRGRRVLLRPDRRSSHPSLRHGQSHLLSASFGTGEAQPPSSRAPRCPLQPGERPLMHRNGQTRPPCRIRVEGFCLRNTSSEPGR